MSAAAARNHRHRDAAKRILLLRCQLGDREALAELVASYADRLRSYVNFLTDHLDMSEDITQEIWLAVLSRIATVRDPDAFDTWLYRVAHNTAVKLLKLKRYFRRLDDSIAAENHDDYEPDYVLDNLQHVGNCLEELQPHHREVLFLRYFEQKPMSYEQISEVVGVSVGTVRSRIHYAKLKLKKLLERHQNNGSEQ